MFEKFISIWKSEIKFLFFESILLFVLKVFSYFVPISRILAKVSASSNPASFSTVSISENISFSGAVHSREPSFWRLKVSLSRDGILWAWRWMVGVSSTCSLESGLKLWKMSSCRVALFKRFLSKSKFSVFKVPWYMTYEFFRSGTLWDLENSFLKERILIV